MDFILQIIWEVKVGWRNQKSLPGRGSMRPTCSRKETQCSNNKPTGSSPWGWPPWRVCAGSVGCGEEPWGRLKNGTCPCPKLGNLCMLPHVAKGTADMIWLLRWREYPGLSRWAHCSHGDHYKRDMRGVRVRGGDMMMETETGVMCFDIGGSNYKPTNVGNCWAEKSKETGSPLEPPEQAAPPTSSL